MRKNNPNPNTTTTTPSAPKAEFVKPEHCVLTLVNAVALPDSAKPRKLGFETSLLWSDASECLTKLPASFLAVGKKYKVTRRLAGYITTEGESRDTWTLVSAVRFE